MRKLPPALDTVPLTVRLPLTSTFPAKVPSPAPSTRNTWVLLPLFAPSAPVTPLISIPVVAVESSAAVPATLVQPLLHVILTPHRAAPCGLLEAPSVPMALPLVALLNPTTPKTPARFEFPDTPAPLVLAVPPLTPMAYPVVALLKPFTPYAPATLALPFTPAPLELAVPPCTPTAKPLVALLKPFTPAAPA